MLASSVADGGGCEEDPSEWLGGWRWFSWSCSWGMLYMSSRPRPVSQFPVCSRRRPRATAVSKWWWWRTPEGMPARLQSFVRTYTSARIGLVDQASDAPLRLRSTPAAEDCSTSRKGARDGRA